MFASLPSRHSRPGYFASLILPVLFAALRLAAADKPAANPCGLCYAGGPAGERIVVPLEYTEVILDVKPGLLEAEVIQTFTNRTSTPLEATYLYPLPDGATLTDCELRYKDRVISSTVREKQAARAVYETAKAEGKKTALVEQHDSSLFSTAVANFMPGETVRIVIRYIQPLTLTSGSVDIRFPMVTGDRYFPAGTTPGTPGNAAANPLRQSGGSLAQSHYYAFDVQVAGIPVQTISSESHRINVRAAGADHYRVSLLDEITLPDRDFLLRIDTRQAAALVSTVVTQRTGTGDYGLLTVFPPLSRSHPAGVEKPRDVLFLLDHSGSMRGPRMASAKLGLERCLPMLGLADRFQIVVFDSAFAFFRPEWSPADAASLQAALKYTRSIEAGSGTEVQKALGPSLDFFEPDDEREQLLVFLTDGDVGNAASLLNLVETKIGRVRLFAFGIGDAPNVPLITRMAVAGHGQARFIKNDDGVDRALADFFATLGAPVLSGLQPTLLDERGQPIDALFFPAEIGDVFLGRPVQVAYRSTGGPAAALRLEGREDGSAVTFRIPLETAPLRGEGVEKHFGRMWYDELESAWRRAPTDALRAQMLDTALLFELVTELTSRVAVEERISRNPNQPLASRQVRQMQPADQKNHSETVELSPFVVSAEEDSGYLATNTLSGTRLSTSLSDVPASITVLTREFIDDFARAKLEDVLPFVMEPAQNPAVARSGADTGLLDGLPVTTVIDPATIDRIEFQGLGPAWSTINQLRAGGLKRSAVNARLGDEGVWAVTLTGASRLGRDIPVLAIGSWAKWGNPQWSGFLSAARNLAAGRVSVTGQARRLDGYGDMQLARVDHEHRFSRALWLESAVAWHSLRREDARQFHRGSPTARYANLGLFNLDLLTADTSRLSDAMAQVRIAGEIQTGVLTHTWAVQGRYHRQESDWLTEADPRSRTNTDLNLSWRGRLAGNGRFRFQADTGWAQHRTPGTTDEQQFTHKAAAGVIGEAFPHCRAFANWSSEQILPWAPTGMFQTGNGWSRAVSQPIEHRRGGQAGLKIDGWHERVSVNLALFHEDVADHLFRDWAWERDQAAGGPVLLPDGVLRLPVSQARSGAWQREGWMGEVTFQPTRAITGRATWYCDWKNNGPYRGGNRQASFAAKYTFRRGAWKGLATGFAVSTRNTLVYNDGYKLSGGLRGDLMFSYERRLARKREVKVQLNLMNLTDASWQPTRFAKDYGRQVLLSVAREF